MSAPPRLFSYYTAAISLGLAVDAQDPELSIQLTGAELQQRMRRLLERANRTARSHKKPTQDVELAAFALAAWFDEIAARRTDWAEAVAPLQLLWFNSTNAATEFFHHLASLSPAQNELRELYWYLLALGFKGQYYFEGGDGSGELAKLRALHASQLPQPPIDLRDPAARLCPQPYAQPLPPSEPLRHRPQAQRAPRVAATVLALLLMVWLTGRWMAPHAPDSTPDSTLAERVTRELQRHTCSAMRAQQHADGVLRVQGFVPRKEDVEAVQRKVDALAGSVASDVQLQWRPWPYCEVVDILQRHQLRNDALRQKLTLRVIGAQQGILREGDRVSLQVQAPAGEGVMWVDYYTADGAVLHLRAQGQRHVRFKAGQALVFGEDLPASWLVSPPFGPILVTVIAQRSVSAQLAAEQAPYELASAYLLRLRETLTEAGHAESPVADVLFLQTRER